MLQALRRFGVPEHVVAVVRAIYTGRSFRVKEGDQVSGERGQYSGISQGCPLSPFLFVILMSILMEDAKAKMNSEDRLRFDRGDLVELLYADDTLLLSVSADSLERFLVAVCDAGAQYGLELHWGKLQLLQVRCQDKVTRPDGSKIDAKEQMIYLEASVSEDGRIGQELVRQLS